jgi:hypothetical protein
MRAGFTCSLALLLALTSTAPAFGACGAWEKLAGYLFPARRASSEESYREARQFWEATLARQKNPSLETILAKLKARGDGRPETLMALMDAMDPGRGVPFQEWVSRLREQGIEVRFRAVSADKDLQARHHLKWGWRLAWALPPVSRKAGVLEIDLPDSVPENAEALFSRIYALSMALPAAQLEVTAARSPLLSYPFGDSKHAYPKQLRDAVQAVEERTYASLHQWESHWGELPTELPEYGASRWLGGYTSLPFALATRVFFPFYNPTSGYRPSRHGFDLYKQGFGASGAPGESPLSHYVRAQYQVRATLKYTVDGYVRVLKLLQLVGLGIGSVKLAQAIQDGSAAAAWDANRRFWAGLGNAEEVNQGLKSYEENEEGDPVVNDTYEPLIRELRAKIAEQGDPTGDLERALQKLIADRNYLRN